MDPLAISASLLTLLGSGGQIGKGLGKLIVLRNAPDAFLALNKEVADLHRLLQEMDDVGRQYEQVPGSQLPSIILTALEKAKETLLDMERLITYGLSKITDIDGRVQLDRSAWLQASSDIRRLKQRIRDDRTNVSTALRVLFS
jgi:hypothetical protein